MHWPLGDGSIDAQVGTGISGESITFTGLTHETNYVITGVLTFSNGNSLKDDQTIVTTETIGTNLALTEKSHTYDEVVIMSTWIAGGASPVKSEYAIMEKDETSSHDIEEGPLTSGGTITFDRLNPGTDYEITGMLTFEDGSTLDTTVPLEVKTSEKELTSARISKHSSTTTDTAIGVRAYWDNGSTSPEEVETIYYEIKSTEFPYGKIDSHETTGIDSETENDSVVFEGLKTDTDYTVEATFKNKWGTEIGKDTETMWTMKVAATEMSIEVIDITNSEVTIENYWINGAELPTSSSYTITDVNGNYTQTISGDISYGYESEPLIFTDLPRGTDYEIIGTLKFPTSANDFSSDPILVTTEIIATNIEEDVAGTTTDTQIGITSSWVNEPAPNEKVENIYYSVRLDRYTVVATHETTGIADTESSESIILENLTTPLEADTNYEITATFKNSLNETLGETTTEIRTREIAASSMSLWTINETETSVTITNSWIDGMELPTGSSYTIVEWYNYEEECVIEEGMECYTETIIGDPVTNPGIESNIITFTDLIPGTKYKITASLTFPTETNDFQDWTRYQWYERGLYGGEIVAIVIGSSIVGITLIGGGSYWLYKSKFANKADSQEPL